MQNQLVRLAEIDRGVEAEQSALGLLLASPDRSELPALDGYPWADGCHREAWDAIRRLRSQGRAAHPAAVHALMSKEAGSYRDMGGMGYLLKLVELRPRVEGRRAEDEHLELLRARAAKLRLIDLAGELAELAGNPSLDARAAIERVWPQLDAIRLGGLGGSSTYKALVEAKIERLKRPAVVYPTGLPAVDDAMQGGIWPGKLYGFAAKRKCGKSLMLGTIALNLAKAGVKALYVTLEQGPDEVTDRMVAADLGYNAVDFLKRNNPRLPEKVAKYAETAPECLLFEDRTGLTFPELRSMVGRYAAKEEIKVFILDYWQLVQGQERHETEAAHLAKVAQWLADAARAHGIAILTAAQINRDGQTLGSDGLRRACSMYLHQHKIDPEPGLLGPENLWLEMEDTRYTARQDVGSEEHPLLYIDRIGPIIRQWGM